MSLEKAIDNQDVPHRFVTSTLYDLPFGRGRTFGKSVHPVVDAVGGTVGLDSAFGLVRRRGTVVSVGVPGVPTWPLPVADAFAAELTLRFAIGDLMRDGDALVALVASGAVDPLLLAPDTVALQGAPDAYRAMAERRSLKTLIVT